MMTRKHFVRIAEILKARKADKYIVAEFGTFCSEQNPNFDYEKFRKAAGIE